MNILVVGAGGREHAICWAIRKSTKCKNLYCAPGNAGIGEVATCVNIGITDTEKIVTFSLEKNIDLVVIGPEDALVIGLADELKKNSILAFGPNKSASILEGSKSFMKVFFDNIISQLLNLNVLITTRMQSPMLNIKEHRLL